MLAENSTLKAALDTYQTELRTTSTRAGADLVATIARELDKLADRIQPDVLEVRDQSSAVLGVAGRRAGEWPRTHGDLRPPDDAAFVTTPAGVFRVAAVPVMLQGRRSGRFGLRMRSTSDMRASSRISPAYAR